MTTETPNYLTAEQERVINDFQRVARELMVDGVTAISCSMAGGADCCYAHGGDQCFIGEYDRTGRDLASSVNDGIHQLRTEIKSPAEQAKLDYEAALKAAEEAKAKLAEFEEAENAQV